MSVEVQKRESLFCARYQTVSTQAPPRGTAYNTPLAAPEYVFLVVCEFPPGLEHPRVFLPGGLLTLGCLHFPYF